MKGKKKKDIIKVLKAGIHLRPLGQCDCCQGLEYVDELQLLPEVETFVRQFAFWQLHEEGMDAPEFLDDQELEARYRGYNSQNLFCRDCLQRLIAEASD